MEARLLRGNSEQAVSAWLRLVDDGTQTVSGEERSDVTTVEHWAHGGLGRALLQSQSLQVGPFARNIMVDTLKMNGCSEGAGPEGGRCASHCMQSRRQLQGWLSSTSRSHICNFSWTLSDVQVHRVRLC